MNIVILDSYTTTHPGNLSWSALDQFGCCTVYDRTSAEQIIERAAFADIVLTNKTPLTAETLEKLPELRYIGVLATGFNVIDMDAASRKNIVVTNIPGYGSDSVCQMVFALLLEMTQQVGCHAQRVREGSWCESPDFCFSVRPLMELKDKTMGLVGFGQIGRQVARVASAFGLRVLVATEHPEKYQSKVERVNFVDMDILFAESDIISLHCPLTRQTQQLVDQSRISQMKTGALLINTGRGPLVDEAAVAAALATGQLGGFAADVLSTEPPAPENPLLNAPHSFITPHIAWATKEARQRLMDLAISNLKAFIDGRPVNVVS